MKRLSLTEQTLFADLIQRCLDAGFDEQFPENGSFTQVTQKGRSYWYYQGYALDPTKSAPGRRYSRYVGPVDDPQISSRVERFKSLKADHQERRRTVSLLKQAGLPTPHGLAGEVVETLWRGGAFRLRCVLVGTVAFQCYAGLLGYRLPRAPLMTQDVDLAQFHSISALVGDSMPPVLENLQSVDPTYRALPHHGDPRLSTAFQNDAGFRVEFLTPNPGSDDLQGRPSPMPALGGAAAQPLRFLGFLITEPVWSVLLHKAGVPVLVPDPARYAVHKLMLSDLRRSDPGGFAKAGKDIQQAATLIRALTATNPDAHLGDRWIEAWDQGPKWRAHLRRGVATLTAEVSADLVRCVRLAAEQRERSPRSAGLGPDGFSNSSPSEGVEQS